jgi:3-phosphoshikimate 1-carboxyvinyltransferase
MGTYRGFADPLPIEPLGRPLRATVEVPGSKSLTNRALLVAGAASGETVLHGVLWSDDTDAMISALSATGVGVEHDIETKRCYVQGIGHAPSGSQVMVNVRRSGTTARFIVPFLAAGSGSFDVDAHDQMRARPMGDLIRSLDDLHVRTEALGAPGFLPLRIHANGLPGGVVSIAGNVSSQFLSGLLLAAPLAREQTTIEVTGELVSVPYVDLTLSVMRAFGAVVQNNNYARLVVEPTGYTSPGEFWIEPDASAASYFFAAAVATGGSVTVNGLGAKAEQGDVRFADVLGELGALVHRTDDSLTVTANGPLHGGTVNMVDCSDTAQTLAAIAPLALGSITVTGIGFIRNKETDRIAAVVTELRRLGIEATEDVDGFTIHPGPIGSGIVQTYDDHRMAMSFAVLGLAHPGIAIAEPACVAKTFREFFDVLDELRSAPMNTDETQLGVTS